MPSKTTITPAERLAFIEQAAADGRFNLALSLVFEDPSQLRAMNRILSDRGGVEPALLAQVQERLGGRSVVVFGEQQSVLTH